MLHISTLMQSEYSEDSESGSEYLSESDDVEYERCSVCLGCLGCDEHETKLDGCGHMFHTKCIVQALQHNRSCPVCRYKPEIVSEPVIDDTESDEASSIDDEEDERRVEMERNAEKNRNRLIRSSFARVQHGSANQKTRTWARRYKESTQDIMKRKRALSHFNACIRRQCCEYKREAKKLTKFRDRVIAGLIRKRDSAQEALNMSQARRESIGDSLAKDATMF